MISSEVKTQNTLSPLLMSLSLLFILPSPHVVTNAAVIVVSTTIQAAVDAAQDR